MPIIQFSHANGFPAQCYHHFFQFFDSAYEFSYVPKFGHGKYRPGRNWREMTQELIADIEAKHSEPIIGMGHSMGGVMTLFASIKRPDLFEKVVILDPPLFNRPMRLFIALTHYLGVSQYVVPIAKKAKNRRSHFDSREQVRASFRKKSLFKNFDEQCFEDYIQHGFEEVTDGKGIKLAYTKEAEFQNFSSTPYWIGSTKLQRPTHFVYAVKGGVLRKTDVAHLKMQYGKQAELTPVEGGHLFPLEQPKKTAHLLQEILQNQT